MLHLYTGSTTLNRNSDPFRMHEAYLDLRAALDTDGMLETNTSTLEPRGLKPEILTQHLSTMPFLAAARLVVVQGLVTLAGSTRAAVQTWQPLLDLLPEVPPTNHLVLLEPAATRDDRRTLERSPLLAALREIPDAEIRDFPELRLNARHGQGRWVNEVAEWTTERAAAKQIPLDSGVAELLADLIGGDLWSLSTELDKLAMYAAGRAVTQQDIRLMTAQAREAEIFALIDALTEGRGADALRLTRRRIEHGGEHPGRVRAAIASQIRNVIRAADILERGGDEATVAAATGTRHPLPLRKVQEQARSIGRPAAEAALRAIEDADYAVKTGKMPEMLALDLLIVDLGRITANGIQANGARSGSRRRNAPSGRRR